MKRGMQWIDVWAVCTSALVLGGFVFVCLLAWTLTAHGQGTPATQPAVVAAGGFWVWFKGNSGWLVPLLINVLSTIATGLSEYPTETPAGASKVQKVIRVLRIAIACLGWAQFKNAPGSLKAVFAPPAKA